MLYFLSSKLQVINLLKYITFRAGCSFFLSFSFVMFFMPRFITWINNIKKIYQPIRSGNLGPDHSHKIGTPTMGGLIIIGSAITASFLFSDLQNQYSLILILSMVLFGSIGLADDLLKVTKKNSKGLSAKTKILLQFLFSILLIGWANCHSKDTWFSSALIFPIFKNLIIDLGILYTLFRIFIIIGSSNAINLTDGLDGLAIVPSIITTASLSVFAYIIGSKNYSSYLLFHSIDGVAETVVVSSALIGASLGFLWFNVKPAQIFMGDVGSLGIGGFLGTMAILIKCEILLGIIGGIFVIEAMSVILQVGYFKLTKGKRLFKMAPIHHHFEKCGWSEVQVVVRFWIISILFAILGLITIKIR